MPNSEVPYIRLDWELPEPNKVTFWVQEQTVRHFNHFEASNGFKIRSSSYPEYRCRDRIFYARGASNSRDMTRLETSVSDFTRLLDAVNEFNRYHASGHWSSAEYRIYGNEIPFNGKIKENYCRGTCGSVLCPICMSKVEETLAFSFGR